MSFREVLQEELIRRRARNPRYSLRAFARALALDHSSLSQLLRGRRRVTTRAIRRIGAILRLPNGAKVLMPKMHLPDGDIMAILLDPAGLSFGVYTPAATRATP